MMSLDAVRTVSPEQVAAIARSSVAQVLVVDSRSFLEFNDLHIVGAVNVCCSKLVKKRLQQETVSQLVFSAPMYRTQSCPGMLPSEDSSLRSTDGGGSEGDSDSDIRLFRRRRRRERIDSDMTGAARHYDLCFDRSKNRNRYSCGNLEFDSCPDIPHFRGCQSAFPSPHGSSSSLSMSAASRSHRPPSIIEVS
ncbi:unnamed protein product [Notodromas monacha]|uniref:Rhodanese domain-containing protein n=1 Tax=Notodromas monacha TaxID=399045 RepID=A0A7R9BQE9_9CRUS|nr:unnamed protein product [Notodromas monacha]CAG0919770.1 unnamed protein product [Notodromas monacha]